MKNKLLLLATAAVFLSPVAAKANQKSSIYVGGTGGFERLASQGGVAAASDYLKDETFGSLGVEAGFGYKVWQNLQVAGWVRGLYSFEHKFAEGKKLENGTNRVDPYAIVIEPRVTLGWEFPVNQTVSITPFLGVGAEMSASKKDGKSFSANWKMPVVGGVRVGIGSVYLSVNARYDLTSAEINAKDAAVGRTEADTARFWGMDFAIGAEI